MTSAFLRVAVLTATLSGVSVAFTSCGGVEGTYGGANGAVVLELRSGGKARMTMMGEAQDCTYDLKGDKVALTCQGQTVDFTKHDDGSLSPPAGAMLGTLTKSK